jgi:hypothetical protein
MKRIETHYSNLSVNILFKHHPRLEESLGQKYDDKLVTRVRPPSNSFASPSPNMLTLYPSR